MTQTQNLTVTLVALLILLAVGAISFRNHFAEKPSIKPHRLPWMIIALGCIATAFMVLVHLANLMGFETGRM